MPVVGLTDTIIPSLPRIGKLRKGAKAEGGFGKELEWFRFVGDEATTAAFVDGYEAQPRFLAPVFLPFATPDENFAVWQEAWGKSGLMHRCDGQMTTIIRKGNKYSRIPEKCPGGCDLVGRLTVILPGLWKAGYVGYVTVETGAVNDVLQIMALLKAVYDGRKDLRGIAFQLRRVQKEISVPKPDSDERMRVKKWLVQLEVAPDWARLQLEMAERAAKMIEAPRPKVIEATGEVVTDLDDDAHWSAIADAAEELEYDPPSGDDEAVLPPEKGGPGWDKVPERKAEFVAIVQAAKISKEALADLFRSEDGAVQPIGTVPLAAAKAMVEGWVAGQ